MQEWQNLDLFSKKIFLMSEEKLTPAMQQFYELKEQNSDAILFFRMWDFYEMFDEDALIANKVLWVAVTSRNKNALKPTPLAWIPYHAKEKYLPLLIEAWYKVAIAEQISDPNLKWIVKREVVRVITPATIWLEWENYDSKNSNIISITENKGKFWLSILNLSENKWQSTEFKNFEEIKWELYKIFPKEVVLEKKLFWNKEVKDTLEKKFSLNIYFFEIKKDCYKNLINHFKTKNLEGFWLEKYSEAQRAASLLLEYIENNQKTNFDFLKSISLLETESFLKIDEATIKNLDLVYNFATKSTKTATLFWILDKTKTASWSNFLYNSILKPLNSIEEIKQRQEFIEEFLKNKILLDRVREELWYISNINNILNRIALNRTSPKDLLNLKKSLISMLKIFEHIKKSDSEKLKKIIK